MPLSIGLILGGVGTVGKFINGAEQKSAASENPYQNDPYAKQQLALAQQMFNARMAGASKAEQNISATQGNTISNINRNATDSAQALALASGTQGTANDAYNNLAIKEAENKQNMLQNLNAAYGKMSGNYQLDEQRRNQLLGDGAKNEIGAINDLGSLGIMGGQLGAFGANATTNTASRINPNMYDGAVTNNTQPVNYFNPTNRFRSAWSY